MHEVDEITNIVTDVVGDPTLPRRVTDAKSKLCLLAFKTVLWIQNDPDLNKKLRIQEKFPDTTLIFLLFHREIKFFKGIINQLLSLF